MKRWFSLFIVACMIMSLVACGSGTSTPSNAASPSPSSSEASNTGTESPTAAPQTGGGTFTLGIKVECSNVAPWLLRSGQERVSWSPVYETLFKVVGDGEIEGYLAESIIGDSDALTYTIKLRPDVTFSDGSKLDADTLLWNFENYKANSSYSTTDFGSVTSFEKISDDTVVIHLSSWTSQVPYSLARNAGLMYSKKAFDENGYDWCLQNPVGTGPYVLDKWVNDEYKTFVKNENYWNTEAKPYFDDLKIVIIGDEAAAQNSLMAGEIDAYHGFSDSSQAIMLNMGGYNRLINKLGYSSYVIYFASDVEGSPISNVLVRQAICHAIDSQAMSNALGFGMTIANNQYAIPGTKFYNDEIQGYPYNPEKAKELLAEAGYPDGFTTTIYTGNDMDMTSWLVGIQGYLKAVGITLRIEILDTSEWITTYLYDIPEGMIFGPRHSFSSNIVNQALSNFSYNAIGGVGMLNKCSLHPADVNDALQASISATSEDEMIAKFKEACKLIIDKYAICYTLANSASSVVICKDDIIDTGCFNTSSDFSDYNLISRAG